MTHTIAVAPAPPLPRWLTVHEAMRVVGVSRRTVYNWLATGKLVTKRTAGGCVRILESSLWRSS